MSASYPLQKQLSVTGSYFIMPVDNKCAVQNTTLQITVTNTSGTLQYMVERTVYPVQQCIYPTNNTPESVLNAQASWISWVAPTGADVLVNNSWAIKGIRITLINAGSGDSIEIVSIQQGVL